MKKVHVLFAFVTTLFFLTSCNSSGSTKKTKEAITKVIIERSNGKVAIYAPGAKPVFEFDDVKVLMRGVDLDGGYYQDEADDLMKSACSILSVSPKLLLREKDYEKGDGTTAKDYHFFVNDTTLVRATVYQTGTNISYEPDAYFLTEKISDSGTVKYGMYDLNGKEVLKCEFDSITENLHENNPPIIGLYHDGRKDGRKAVCVRDSSGIHLQGVFAHFQAMEYGFIADNHFFDKDWNLLIDSIVTVKTVDHFFANTPIGFLKKDSVGILQQIRGKLCTWYPICSAKEKYKVGYVEIVRGQFLLEVQVGDSLYHVNTDGTKFYRGETMDKTVVSQGLIWFPHKGGWMTYDSTYHQRFIPTSAYAKSEFNETRGVILVQNVHKKWGCLNCQGMQIVPNDYDTLEITSVPGNEKISFVGKIGRVTYYLDPSGEVLQKSVD